MNSIISLSLSATSVNLKIQNCKISRNVTIEYEICCFFFVHISSTSRQRTFVSVSMSIHNMRDNHVRCYALTHTEGYTGRNLSPDYSRSHNRACSRHVASEQSCRLLSCHQTLIWLSCSSSCSHVVESCE